MANDSTNNGLCSPEKLAGRRRQWDALDVDWRVALEEAALGCDASGGARPGQPCEVGNITVVPSSDSYWVMDARHYDRLMRLYRTRVVEARPVGLFDSLGALIRNRRPCNPNYLPGFLADAVEVLRAGLQGEGSGPVAPCFDLGDHMAEAGRGKWYVFDGVAYLAFGEVVRPLFSRSRG